jgi:pyruvate dehydrogenase E2 component (dihydrolipoamide acetyltransferase)
MNILMPQLGETVTEGTISKWYKAVGDKVEAGEILFEIETDKTSMEVPAIEAGFLTEIRAVAGQTVPVGAIISVMSAEAAKTTASPAPTSTVVTEAKPTAKIAPALPPAAAPSVKRELDPFSSVRSPERNFGSATLPGGVKVTPLARRLAAEKGLGLAGLKGSGPHGRIIASDVRQAHASPASPSLASGPGADQIKSLYANVPFQEIPLDGMRRTIARRLVESKQTVPHFYLSADVSVEKLLELRKQINAVSEVKISVNDCIVKAYALALQKVPAANAVWAEDRLLQFQRSDIGVAVAVKGGLVTPVVRSADLKSLSVLATEIADLAARGRERKLKPAEYQGGTATVSNLGMFGVRDFAAIVNPPQATILAVGAADRRPEENESGGVRFTSKLTVTLSVDHRAVDGAVAGELLAAFRGIVENPLHLVL